MISDKYTYDTSISSRDREIKELEDMQKAVLNILEDSSEEQTNMVDFQRATFNILEDLNEESGRFEETQRAVLNILEDAQQEKENLEETQKATLNILEDFDEEKVKVTKAYEALQKEVEARKEAEKYKHYLAALVDSADDAIFSKTLDGIITSWNRGAEELYGYKAEEAIGKHISFLVPAGHKDEIADFLNRIMHDEKVKRFETERYRKDGSIVSVLKTLSPIKDQNGKIVGVSAVARDITERKIAEQQLREAHDQLESRVQKRTTELSQVNVALQEQIAERRHAEEQFRIVVESAPNAMIMIDESGKIMLVNKMTEHLFGYRRTELLNQSLEILLPHNFKEGHKSLRDSFFSNPEVRPMGSGKDLFGLRKDGAEVPIEIGLSPVKTKDGTFVLAAIVDVSERKQTEQLIRSKNQELETLLYIVSHDLMEPLRGIEYFSSAVNERYTKVLDEKGSDYLMRVVRAAERMRNLLKEILMISRARRFTVSSHFVNGKVIINEALSRLGTKINETNATIKIADSFPKYRVEKTWAIQAVYNLINNALKYTVEDKAPEVVIEPYFDPEKSTTGIAVCDRGPGVLPQYRDKIFELFQRAVKREVEGTGAGLAIVKEVALRHKGHAWVESRKGGGSKFIITFGKQKEITQNG